MPLQNVRPITNEVELNQFLRDNKFAVLKVVNPSIATAPDDFDLRIDQMSRWHSQYNYQIGNVVSDNIAQLLWLLPQQRAGDYSVSVYWMNEFRLVTYERIGEYVDVWIRAVHDCLSGDGTNDEAEVAGLVAIDGARNKTANVAAGGGGGGGQAGQP